MRLRDMLCLSVVAILLGAMTTAQADVPQLINYQGILTDPGTGLPVVGSTPAVISVYQGGTSMAGGTLVYTEDATLTTNDNGSFKHLIGSEATNADPEHTLSPLDFVTSDPVWLEVEIGGSPLLPRPQLVTVPYAMAVGTVDGSSGGVISGDVSISGGNLNLDLSSSSVGNILKDGNPFVHDFGTNNTFIGNSAGNFTMTGYDNTATGVRALESNTEGIVNTATGVKALESNTEGFANTATGHESLRFNTTGHYNTASGTQALFYNTTGHHNTAYGSNALSSNITGYYNTATGVNALYHNTTGTGITANGLYALYSNTTGNSNTASGLEALNYNTTGNSNTACGFRALYNNNTGSSNTAVGYTADVSAGDLTNATAIGYGAEVDASNKIRLGNDDVTVIEGRVADTWPSDKNDKENFQPVDGDEVLRKIRGLDLTSWNYIGHDPQQFRHYGPVAQEFFAAFGHDDVGTSGTPTTINSGDMAGILMIAVQALEKRTAEVEAMRAQMAEMQAMMQQLLEDKE